MSSRDFCFWLQGKLEIDAAELGAAGTMYRPLTTEQVKVIANHLALVLKNVTQAAPSPPVGWPFVPNTTTTNPPLTDLVPLC
jgi:hypothetical protein